MANFNKSQLLVLLVLALLLIITPLLPSSLKPTYLYFIFNLLIISLGAEAGLLSAFPGPSSEDKRSSASAAIPERKEASTSTGGGGSESGRAAFSEVGEKKPEVIPERFVKVKKCAPMPSLFFLGEAEAMEEEVEAEDEVGEINGQELLVKADAFIGNFYRQLKMQRD